MLKSDRLSAEEVFEDPELKYCENCLRVCKKYIEDDGIGAYEFWGAPGFDSRIIVKSGCCGAEVITYSERFPLLKQRFKQRIKKLFLK
jgi:hypothetical protein